MVFKRQEVICHGIRLPLAVDVQGLHQPFSLLETGTLKLPNEAWRRLAGTEQRREPGSWAQREGGSWRMEGRYWAARMDERQLPGSQVAKWLCYSIHPGQLQYLPFENKASIDTLPLNIFTGFLYPFISLLLSDASPLASPRGSEAWFYLSLPLCYITTSSFLN